MKDGGDGMDRGLRLPRHPALREHAKERRSKVENRAADAITAFAGSMSFVYVHVVWFVVWITLPVEDYPFGLLTMIVSLEAIFLSTFILITQNRTDEKRQALADHHWDRVQSRDADMDELMSTARELLELARDIHDRPEGRPPPRTVTGARDRE
jgi:uncharacterized membrane protein